MMTAAGAATPTSGLSAVEAARLLAARGEIRAAPTSRSYASIVRANVLTVFNLVLAVFGGLTLAFGEWRDALFLGVLVANTVIGITQELRAKRALDRLAALVAPHATVVRDGQPQLLPVAAVVPGDLVRVQPGDQLVADGVLATAAGLRVDESVLTGESRPVERAANDEVRSGSFAVEGTGAYVVTAVGPDSYAEQIAGVARAFRGVRSPLERSLSRLLLVLCAAIAPLGLILGYALWERHEPLSSAVPTTVAAAVTLVPEGLILLASLTYAVAALRMARRGVLAQRLSAIESLASVDVVCIDKTGTLTEGRPRVVDVVPADGQRRDEVERALARYAAATSGRNGTLEAVAEAFPAAVGSAAGSGAAPTALGEVPFGSAWRWGGVDLDDGAWLLGAPELLELGPLAATAERLAAEGRRVVGFAHATAPLAGRDPADGPPAHAVVALVVLAERLRGEARETIAFLHRQGVAVKVLSGDRPETVAAIARDVGIEVAEAIDGSTLPDDPTALAALVARATVIGRIAPEGKRRVVEALAASGSYVAMLGDGVNDVPALKAARLAIAQGSGAQMAKSIADIVLISGDFAAIPQLVYEGRKILRNLQRVAKLFVAKSAFAAFLIVSIGLTPTAYPLLPRHLTLVASLTIGIPGFFLALAPSSGSWRSNGFLRAVGRFSVPAGTAAGLAVLSSYTFALHVLDLPLVEARTVATTALMLVGLYLIVALEATGLRRSAWVGSLCGVMLTAYAATIALPWSRSFFALATPSVAIVLTAVAGSALALLGLWLTGSQFAPGGSAESD